MTNNTGSTAAREINRAFDAQAFVVDRPWGDGDWIVLGSPDPHQATIVADCSMIDDTQGEELPYTNAEAAAEIARRWNALPDECERRNAYAVEVMRLESEVDELKATYHGAQLRYRNAERELAAYKPVIAEVRKCYDRGVDMPAPVEVAFAHARQATNLRRLR